MFIASRFNIKIAITVLVTSIFMFGQPMSVAAEGTLTQNITDQFDTAGNAAGLSDEDPRTYVASAIKIILGITGTLFLILIVFAGYVRLTAHGEEERVKKSNSTAIAALLGLAIVLLAYGITVFVTTRIYNASTYEPKYEENNSTPNTTFQKTIKLDAF
jgi:hypothetical protein